MFKNKNFTILVFITFFFRILTSLYFGDNSLKNEWFYLVTNLREHNTLAILNFNDFYLPNLWMPPLYAYFLYVLSLPFENLNYFYINFVLIIQCIVATLAVIIFFKILTKYFSDKISLIGLAIYSFFPLNLYASSQISEISLTTFMYNFFYLYFVKICSQKNSKYLIIFAFLSGLLFLLRREFIIFFMLTIIYLLIYNKINFKKIFIIFLITILTISPYLIRNYKIFNSITLYSGFGYNVWKAYNPNADVEGSVIHETDLIKKINKIPKNINYRINEDKIYLAQGIKYLAEDKIKNFKLYIKRFFSFYFVNFNYSHNSLLIIFYIIPGVIVSTLSTIGLIKYDRKSLSLNYFFITHLVFIFLISFFGVMPRYHLYILSFQVVLISIFLKNLIHKKY